MVKSEEATVKTIIDEMRPKLGEHVVDIRYEMGEDWAGEPGVFIYVVVDNDLIKDLEHFNQEASKIEKPLFDKLIGQLGAFPYINFRSAASQAEVDEKAASLRR